MARKEHPLKGKRGFNMRDKVWAYMDSHPNASNAEIAQALQYDMLKVGKYASKDLGGKATEARVRRLELRVKALEAALERIALVKGLSDTAISPTRFVTAV